MGRHHSAYRVTALEDTDYSETMRRQSRAASRVFAQALNIEPTKNKRTIVFAPEVEMLQRELAERDIALNEAAAKIAEKDKRIGELCLALESRADSSDPSRANRIIRAVAAAHGLTFSQMISQRRQRNITRARQHAMWELREHTSLSYPQIARLLGRGDHTTALHGCRAHEARLARGEA
jgi:chromosomal replication initiation ATPase DnaA